MPSLIINILLFQQDNALSEINALSDVGRTPFKFQEKKYAIARRALFAE